MDRGTLVTLLRILAEEILKRQAEKFDAIKAKRCVRQFSTVLPQSPCLYTIPRIVYSDSAMWNVNERFEKKAIDSLAALGFGVGSRRCCPRGEIWFRCGVPAGARRALSHDRLADHHAEREIHPAVGRGLPEISFD